MISIIEKIKEKVQAAFDDVESKEFLEKTVKNSVEKHRRNFAEFKAQKPNESFEFWKTNILLSVNLNSTNKDEIMSIGIFLLALDEFAKEHNTLV